MLARSIDLDSRDEVTARPAPAGRLRELLPAIVGLVVFVAALEGLRLALKTVNWPELMAAVVAIPRGWIAVAVLLTAVNYIVLIAYDVIAFAYIGKQLALRRIAMTSFLAYAISNNVGLAMLSGASVRYRFYTRWGVTTEELSRIIFSYSVTFWLGLFVLGGLSIATTSLPASVPAHGLMKAIGWLLVLVPIAYVATAARSRAPLRLWKLDLPMPPSRLAAMQVGVSVLDWALVGAVLYVLLPPSGLSLLGFLGLFFVAILLGIASHVPGGVGVFEGIMVLLLQPYLTSAQLLPALVVFRVIYYLCPFVVALALLAVDGMQQRRQLAVRAGAALGRAMEQITPRVLSVFTFASGAVLLWSGAMPATGSRLSMITRILPLHVVEASHFVGSVTGVGLLLLSQGLARRLDGAFYVVSFLLLLGVAASLLKGFDYEEAIVLLLVLVVLWRARPAFDRRAAFFQTRFSAGWVMALGAAVLSSIWLGRFVFEHVDYSHDLWWQFAVQGDASRFLRASVGASIVLLLFGFARLIGFAPHEAPPPDEVDLADAERAIAMQTSSFPNLVFLRDKTLLFDDERRAFVMYAVQGRTWVALGDPVGPEDRLNEVIRLFLERCADFGAMPVFYEVTAGHLHRYADFGLTFVKLGEEAKVDLTTFTLTGGQAARHRQTLRRVEKEGGAFRIVAAADVPPILDQLRAVSDEWLAAKPGGEKGFSLGFFDDDYLRRFPIAVVERDARVVAFANIWAGPQQVEFSIDLMRYGRGAPKGVMEALLVYLMQWAKAQGYQRFVLGMAPLSGFEQSPVAPVWNRIGAFVYEHGDAVYNFQGLRAYKEKFNPRWEPHYLAYPGGLRLPRVLADVSALVAGGYARIFRK
jgi:phosphatidylglycerol lysyltransferase